MKGFLRGGKESDASAQGPEQDGNREQEQVAEQGPADFTTEELREFLEADGLEISADPAFKERLRRTLWEMVRRNTEAEPGSDDEGT